ncbi:MAG: PKD domain-containing protein [Bacteroidia bacterium]
MNYKLNSSTMKSITTKLKNVMAYTIKTLLLFIVLSISNSGFAQCTAYFITSVPQNNGVVNLYDSSTYSGQYIQCAVNWGDGTTEMANLNSIQYLVHTYNSTATYNICYTITDSLDPQCNDTYCDSVTVSTSANSCNLYNINFYDSLGATYFHPIISGNVTNYFWDFGDGTTSTQSNPFHTFATGGNYIICLTASNPQTSCNAIYCDTFFVSSCSAAITYVNDSVGNGVTFFANAVGTANTYLWNFGDGNTSTLANPYHVYGTNGNYTVALTVSSSSDSNCMYTTTNYLIMNGLCDANFIVIQDSINLSNFWILNYSSNNSNTTFLWTFGDGDSSSLQYPTHTYLTTGAYNLCVTVSDNNACSDTHCAQITALRSASGTSITVIAPETLGINESIEHKTNLKLFPNPSKETFNMELPIQQHFSVSIVDITGRKMYENKNVTGILTVDCSGFSSGVYFVKAMNENTILTGKLVKE